MATTCQDIIDGANARHTANEENVLMEEDESIVKINDRLQQLYVIAADANPYYFGEISEVTGDGSKWDAPADVESVVLIESAGDAGTGADAVLTTGDEVHSVPLEDKECDLAPRVYFFGGSYYSVGGTGDPSASVNGDKLNFYHAAQHAALDIAYAANHANNTLEARWPEQFNALLELHLAIVMCIKDVGRESREYEALIAEEARVLQAFEAHLRHEDVAVRARHERQPDA